MRRLTLLIVLAAAAVSWGAFRPAATTDATAVEGVWKTVHVTTINDQGTQENEIIQPNLTIITANHWATLSVRTGQTPREQLPEDPTDEQLLAAWRPFFANAGTYEVKGNEMHTKIIVDKDPNATAAQGEANWTFEVDDDTMVRTITNQAGVTFKVKYERVE
jgi:hypothetical protein